MGFQLSLRQFFKSKTVWSIALAAAAELSTNWHPINHQLAQAVSLFGFLAAMYFRANPSQMPTAQNQALIADAVQRAIRAGHPVGQAIKEMTAVHYHLGSIDTKTFRDNADAITDAIGKAIVDGQRISKSVPSPFEKAS